MDTANNKHKNFLISKIKTINNNLAILFVICVLAEISYAMIIPLLSLYLKEGLLASVSLIGFIVSFFAVCEILLRTPSGILSDRMGRKRVIAYSCALASLSPLSMSMLNNPYLFIPIRIFDAFGVAALWPSIVATIADNVKEKDRATTMSIMNVIYFIGIAVGPPLGLFIAKIFYSYRASFLLSGYLLVIASILAALFLNTEDNISTKPKESTTRSFILTYKKLPFQIVLAIFLIPFTQMFAVGTLIPILPIYAKEILGLQIEHLGLLFLLPVFFLILLAIPIGKAIDYLGKAKSVKLGIFISTIFIWFLPWLKELHFLVFIGFGFGIGYAFSAPAWMAYLTKLTTTEMRATLVAFSGTASAIGLMIGPILGGLLWENFSPQTPFILSACLFTLTCITSLLILREVNLTTIKN